MPVRCSGVTSRSGSDSRARRMDRCSNSDAAPDASLFRSPAAALAVVGIDRSEEMLARARKRVARARLGRYLSLVRGDIRELPFTRRTKFSAVLAAYGILQSLTRERDLTRTFASVARVLRRGGLFAIDVVPDLPKWDEYRNRTSLSGRRGRDTTLTLVETVRQDRARRLTIFDQEYRERRGGERRVYPVFPDLSHPHGAATDAPARAGGIPRAGRAR